MQQFGPTIKTMASRPLESWEERMLHWPHHDWLHVLGNYDVTVIGEVENAAFGAASSNKPGATLWFLGVMAMYEGGLFDSVSG